jgi:hypothetical protein
MVTSSAASSASQLISWIPPPLLVILRYILPRWHMGFILIFHSSGVTFARNTPVLYRCRIGRFCRTRSASLEKS